MPKIIKGTVVITLVSILIAGGYFWNILRKVESTDPLVWESDIEVFRKADLKGHRPNHPIVLVGSSSIALYPGLEKLMQPHPIVKRGFGGASVSDVRYYRKEIIDKHKPSKLIIYVGAIDIYYHHQGKPEHIAKLVNDLFSEIQKKNPDTVIYYIAVRPSPFQRKMWQDIERVNEAIKQIANKKDGINFINANHVVRDSNGELIKDIYKFDETHLNVRGNELWWAEIKRQVFAH